MGEAGQQVDVEISKPFDMAATQTTQVVWKRIVEAAQTRFPGEFDTLELDPSIYKGDLYPVERISYHFGDNEDELDEYAWLSTNSEKKPHPVAQKLPLIIGSSPFFDLHGNVWEWVSGWYTKNLKGGVDPQGVTLGSPGSFRIIRGGAWYNDARFLRSSPRTEGTPATVTGGAAGFRLVRIAP